MDQHLFPLTHPEQRELITEQLYPGTAFANNPFLLRFKGKADAKCLEIALMHLIEKHEALRTEIHQKEGIFYQYIRPFQAFPLDYMDFSDDFGKKRFRNWLDKVRNQAFRLTDSRLFYAAILKLPEEETALFLNIHHIVSDGYTFKLLIDQLQLLYQQCINGENLHIPGPISHIEYLKFEEEYAASLECKKDQQFWKDSFEQLPPEMVHPMIRSRKANIEAEHHMQQLDVQCGRDILEFCHFYKMSWFGLMLGAWSIYLQKVCRHEEITVGSMTHNRNRKEMKNMAGMFVNAVPLVSTPDPEAKCIDFLKNNYDDCRYILKNHSAYPFDLMMNDLREEHPQLHNLLNYMIIGQGDYSNELFDAEIHFSNYEQPPFHLILNLFFNDSPGSFRILYVHPKEAFSKKDIQSIHNQLVYLIKSILDQPEALIKDLGIASPELFSEKMQLEQKEEKPLDSEDTVVDIFRKVAAHFPEATALVFGEQKLSYHQVDQLSERLALYLQNQGMEKGEIVAVLSDPDPLMLLGPLAVLKAGGVYMPVDHQYPEDRVSYMLEDAKCRYIITKERYIENLKDFGGMIINANDFALEAEDIQPLQMQPTFADDAYIIYTSGSTGKPKGVLIGHKALRFRMDDMLKRIDAQPDDRFTKFAGFGFDASVFEIFPAILSGAGLYILPDDLRRSVDELFDYINEQQITKAFLPTQFLEQFMEKNEATSLKIVYTGGDKLQKFKPQSYKVLNFYGPTECTVYATCFEVDKYYENIPIGKAAAHTRIYILDPQQKPLPTGIPGELCIAGKSLATSYLNQPEKTAAVFVDDPFFPGEKMYRSGDLARYRNDGNIEFLGRIDFQVKIRGFRIEPEEIERTMLQYNGIREAVVLPRKDAQGKDYLCGYYTASAKPDSKSLHDFMAKVLPDYMIPAYLIHMEHMPISTSGKIDRHKLPEPSVHRSIEKPANGVEEKLVEFWKDILGLEEIGVTENFFDLGGHSLKITQLQSRINEFFHADINFSTLFTHPDIRQQAILIKSARKVSVDTIEQIPNQEYYPVSSAQKRLVFWEEMADTGLMNNIPLIIRFRGSVSEEKISQALDRIIQRHEALRTSFDIIHGEAVQIIHPEIRFKKKIIELHEDELQDYLEHFIQPFDIRKAPLFRIVLVKFSAESYALLMDFHHCIFDGSSFVLFFNELYDLYRGHNPENLRIQYRDFSDWQNRIHISDMMQEHEEYWLNLFRDEVPVLDLPTDFPRPAVLQHEGNTFSTKLDAKISAQIKDFAAQEHITLYPFFTAVFNTLLAKYSHKEDIVIGAGMAGRSHVDIQRLIGMFVNTLVLRNKPENKKTFKEFVKEVHENFLEAYDHQDFQFEHLVEKLKVARDASRNPIYDVALVYQSMGFPQKEYNGLQMIAEEIPSHSAHADIMLEVAEEGDCFRLNWEYRTSLYEEDSIERMSGHFKQLLKGILQNPEKQIAEYEMVTAPERQQLLYDFNQTDASWPEDQCVHYIIEDHAKRNPEQIAISFRGEQMSYGELNHKANQLAHYLRNTGIAPDDYVGIMMDNSFEMIISILGILKSGGCYVPMKPDFPADRVKYMLENCGAKYMVTVKKYFDKAEGFHGQFIDTSDPQIFEGELPNPERINKPSDLIYVIYTSGSTGKPKGVMLEHRNIVRLFLNSEMPYSLSSDDVWSMFHAFSFDFSIWEIFGALLYGARLVVVPKDVVINPDAFLQLLKDEQVSILSQTPGAFYNLIEKDLLTQDHDLKIRYVTFGGEALKPALLADWHKKYPKTRLINMYGITETTVHVTFKEIGDFEIDNNISNIGVPIPTLRTYIMDTQHKLMPIGVPGEICVAGDGLARAYLGLPELTAEKFMPNPYVPTEKIYRSGDLARILANGEMEYLGRIDFQVKIRGFRIELGEIESKLIAHPDIHETVVLARDDKEGNKYLSAYLETEANIPVHDIKEFLKKDLPDYMIPSYFISMAKFPINVNGKVDRKALPLPDEHITTGAAFKEAENDAQKKIAAAFRKTLGLEKISIEDDFFDLGGHSLKAVSLVAELQKDFELSVNDVFEYRTTEKLAENIIEKKENIGEKLSHISEIMDKQAMRVQEFLSTEKYKNRLNAYRTSFMRYEQLHPEEKRNYQHILLTGTTGYLGVHLLDELLQKTEAHIYAIVRGKDQEEAKNRLIRHTEYYFGKSYPELYEDRLSVLNGDLGAIQLGLDDEVYKYAAQNVDAIFHPAALVKHYGDLSVFRKNNVEAVGHLIDFALDSKNKDLHHVSTLSVFTGEIDGQHNAMYTEDDYDQGQRSDNYYAQTKFEAEKLVMDARNKGIKTNIYRIGNVSVNSKTGHLQSDVEGNAFYSVLKGYVNIGAVPDSFNEVEFAWVNELAAAIVRLGTHKELYNSNWHLWNTNKIELADVLTDDALNLNIEKLDFDAFIAYLSKHYDVDVFKPHIEKILLHMGWLGLLSAQPDEVLSHITTEHIFSERTDYVLKKLGFIWPKTDAALIRKMLIQALSERLGFMKQSPLFEKMDEALLEQLAPIMRRKYFEEGEDVLWENDPVDHLQFIENGFVELSRHSATGWLGTIGVLHQGEQLGIESLSKDKRAAVIAEAILGGLTLYEMDNEKLLRIGKEHPEIAFRLMDLMSDRIRKLETMIVNLG